MPDGILKNLDVVRNEWEDWWQRMKEGSARFKEGTFDPREKENYLHLSVNMLEETIDALPRTITYALILGGIAWLVI